MTFNFFHANVHLQCTLLMYNVIVNYKRMVFGCCGYCVGNQAIAYYVVTLRSCISKLVMNSNLRLSSVFATLKSVFC